MIAMAISFSCVAAGPVKRPADSRREEKSGARDERRLEQRRETFHFAVAVAVVFVGGFQRNFDREEGHDGNAGIDHRVDQRGEDRG
jgi:hypothetical protein